MPNNKNHLDIISEAFGLSKLPKAAQDSLLEEIDMLVFRSVLFRIMVNLDEEDKDELNDVLENAGEDFEKPFGFLQNKIKNFDKIVYEEVERIKNESGYLVQSFA